ncbi:MAG: hypothetical protein Q8N53_04475 [Longimicrobiales bacterium]|nr:hypothetical protein [Longimicrobiales bacterium]
MPLTLHRWFRRTRGLDAPSQRSRLPDMKTQRPRDARPSLFAPPNLRSG